MRNLLAVAVTGFVAIGGCSKNEAPPKPVQTPVVSTKIEEPDASPDRGEFVMHCNAGPGCVIGSAPTDSHVVRCDESSSSGMHPVDCRDIVKRRKTKSVASIVGNRAYGQYGWSFAETAHVIREGDAYTCYPEGALCPLSDIPGINGRDGAKFGGTFMVRDNVEANFHVFSNGQKAVDVVGETIDIYVEDYAKDDRKGIAISSKDWSCRLSGTDGTKDHAPIRELQATVTCVKSSAAKQEGSK